jgi:hypothetical protein
MRNYEYIEVCRDEEGLFMKIWGRAGKVLLETQRTGNAVEFKAVLFALTSGKTKIKWSVKVV